MTAAERWFPDAPETPSASTTRFVARIAFDHGASHYEPGDVVDLADEPEWRRGAMFQAGLVLVAPPVAPPTKKSR